MAQHGTTPLAISEPLTAEQIAALPVYEWDVAQIGDQSPAFTYLVTEASIADYCRAVRNHNVLYQAGPGAIAPPTYAFKCAPPRRNEVMHARGYASPEEKGVRATPYVRAELSFVRPIRPGDEITSLVNLEDKYERRGSQFITWRIRAVDRARQPVVEYTYTIIWQQAPSSARPAAAPAAVAAESPWVEPRDRLPSVTKRESQQAIDQYAELTRVRPRLGLSLHSDAAFAQRTIFGGTVNMGVATAAYCCEALEQAFGPLALLRPGGRLAYKAIRPVRAGDEVLVTGHVAARAADGVRCELAVHNQNGSLCGVAEATVPVDRPGVAGPPQHADAPWPQTSTRSDGSL